MSLKQSILYMSLTVVVLFFANLAMADYLSDLTIEDRILIAKAASTTEIRRKFLLEARLETREVVARAYNNPNAGPRAKEVYQNLWNYLGNPVLTFAEPGTEFNFCIEHKNTAAFYNSGKIYYCSSYLESAEYDRQYLVATIIHETAHATGMDAALNERDLECGAMAVEMSTLNHSGRGASPSLRNPFVADGRCKLNRAYHIPEKG